MVSWNDNENSEDSALNMCSSCDNIIKLRATMHDQYFNGTDIDVNVLCEHGKPIERFVAFEGMHTGRRFLGCGEKEVIDCEVVQWIYFEWPDSMEKALEKLWDMYEETAQAKLIRKLKNNHLKEKERPTEERHELQHHISELQKSEEKMKLKIQGVKAMLDE
ncbi:hypothetical protein ZWY2020_020190 [Hordeum vulgare]|nr:hypothetical protein ZWY2020_057922 [Hordeum vulgare]KAI4987390.1 hypothetical protein ZWY2020_020190 [Hordeum vulgare]